MEAAVEKEQLLVVRRWSLAKPTFLCPMSPYPGTMILK
jgi:hypothetical protein